MKPELQTGAQFVPDAVVPQFGNAAFETAGGFTPQAKSDSIVNRNCQTLSLKALQLCTVIACLLNLLWILKIWYNTAQPTCTLSRMLEQIERLWKKETSERVYPGAHKQLKLDKGRNQNQNKNKWIKKMRTYKDKWYSY